MNKLSVVIILSVGLAFGCKKNAFITSKDASVSFSTDTLFFDTVFATTGSVTQMVKIINSNDKKLLLSDIRLMGGSQSNFAINIDGTPGPAIQNLELDAGDSIYVFVAVRITQGSATMPFLIMDSIQVAFNGNQQFIQLQAWGQNAHFLRNQTITGQVTWDKSLPYVILGSLRIDTNASLTIQPGCRIYLHADAPLLVDGTLQATGGKADSARIYFLGDRLDAPYNSYPASWPGIYFRATSNNCNLTYTVIRNANQAIVAQAPAGAGSPLQLNQCIIDNSYDAGILSAKSSITAANCLISNCGRGIVLSDGGSYQFVNCTAVGYSNNFIAHTQPALALNNYLLQGSTPVSAPLTASFTNCIFWGDYGNVADEVTVDRQGAANTFNVSFSSCLWKLTSFPAGIDTSRIIANANPKFDSVNTMRAYYDFHLRPGSPAAAQGIPAGLPTDLDGNPRPNMHPDLGCYQQQ